MAPVKYSLIKDFFSKQELEIIQKLDGIIADLIKDGLHDIAINIEIEKQKVAQQFNQAEFNGQQIDLEEYL